MKLITQQYSQYLKLVLSALILISSYSCSKSGDTPETSSNVYWKTSSTVGALSGSTAIIIEGTTGAQWKADITAGQDWCSFSSSATLSSKTGVVNSGLTVLYVYYRSNTSAERKASISVQIGDEAPKTLELNQQNTSQQNLPATIWAEIPEMTSNSNYQYTTHYVSYNSHSIRNYSLCFDRTKKLALWVAYPIHSAYLGSAGRTDAWGFDPNISSSDQVDCILRSYQGNYDRGHQIPSADRTGSSDMNAQTFYMSNMTPQLDRLNQDMWAKLEEKVRSNKCTDTLFVVTGCYFTAGSNQSTYDGAGQVAPIPTNYFKVILRTKSGSTGKAIKDCTDNELISIGFWVEHRSYGNIQPPTTICTSVSDIENKTGFKFFPQVSATVKQQNNPSQWGI